MIVVGVDAGATKTAVAIFGNGDVTVSRGEGANAARGSQNVAAVVAAIVASRGFDAGEIAALHVAADGAGGAFVAGQLSVELRARFPNARVGVGHDAEAALRAGIPEGPGIVLVAGTGSVAYAENGRENFLRGGLGYLIGDEGSGFAIGQAATRLLARSLDGGAPPDELTHAIADVMRVRSREDLVQAVYHDEAYVAKAASLAPQVLRLASAGVRSAHKIVQGAASDLADLAKSVSVAAGLLDDQPSVVLSGGLLRENSLLSYLLETRITNDIPGANLIRNAEPHEGALRLAMRLLAPA